MVYNAIKSTCGSTILAQMIAELELPKYAIDYMARPKYYDTDAEKFTISYTGIINRHPQVTWWFPSSAQETISVKFKSGIAGEV